MDLTENLLLSIIDLYVLTEQQNRQYYMQHGKNKRDNEAMPVMVKFQNFLTDIDPSIDHVDFIHQLVRLREVGTFMDAWQVEVVKKGLDGYRLIPPRFIENCFVEFEQRSKVIDRIVDKPESLDRGSFENELKEHLSVNSHNAQSELSYLEGQFLEVREKIKEFEKAALDKYGYFLEHFYKGESFAASKDALNMFFYSSEAKYCDINVFRDAFLTLRKYMEAREMLQVLKRLINGYKVPVIAATDNFILDQTVILRSYEEFNGLLFEEMPLANYINCFNLNFQSPSPPKFKKRQQVNFVYFLSQIEGVTDPLALERFGVKNYKQQKSNMTNREAAFTVKVNRIFKSKTIIGYLGK